jgi:crossover junction endodeoxyribonuclease RuvC
MSVTILAVDPGLQGALALYDGRNLKVMDVPTFVQKAGARATDRKFIDEAQLFRAVASWGLLADWLYLEQVGGMPNQGAAGAFKFGRGVGVIIGAAIAFSLAREEVHPNVWKSALKVPADKRAARNRACELLPEYAGLWPLQKHDGRAEAAMLAVYGHKMKGAVTP